MGDNPERSSQALGIRFRELLPCEFDKYIEFDAPISWEFVNEDLRRELSYEEYRRIHREIVSDILESNLDNRIFVAVSDENEIIGLAWVGLRMDTVNYVPIAYLYDIEVKKEFRGFGVGSKLLELVEEACKGWGAYGVMLSVSRRNRAALTWYTRNGYSVDRLILFKKMR